MSADTDREESFTGGYRWGLIAERQRIITLLREHISYAVLVEDDADGILQTYEIEELVALIRGEA